MTSTRDDDGEGIRELIAETGDADDPVMPDLDTVRMIVDGFKEKFGNQAVDVAKAQLELAGLDTVWKWREVVSRLNHGSR